MTVLVCEQYFIAYLYLPTERASERYASLLPLFWAKLQVTSMISGMRRGRPARLQAHAAIAIYRGTSKDYKQNQNSQDWPHTLFMVFCSFLPYMQKCLNDMPGAAHPGRRRQKSPHQHQTSSSVHNLLALICLIPGKQLVSRAHHQSITTTS